ncbi:9193_t:CDS:2, partial [Gigaspora rosea]
MTSIFCAISFIKTISNANKFIAGIAIYRAGDDEFVEEIWKKQIALIIGRFAIENDELNPICPFKYFILGDEPSIYDLPIAPAFGVFTAPIQDPTVIKNGQGIFRLKKDVYNGVTTNQSSLSILCKYPLHNRHANIKDATT